MQLFVKLPYSGRTCTLDVEPSATIAHVKLLIEQRTGLAHTSLIFKNQTLEEDARSLTDYNICKESTLQCVVPIRDAPPMTTTRAYGNANHSSSGAQQQHLPAAAASYGDDVGNSESDASYPNTPTKGSSALTILYKDKYTQQEYDTTSPDFEGPLTKRSKWFGQWRRRHCLLIDSRLFFCRDEFHLPHQMTELETCRGVESSNDNDKELDIVTKDGIKLTFLADSTQERNEWILRINAVFDNLQQASSSPPKATTTTTNAAAAAGAARLEEEARSSLPSPSSSSSSSTSQQRVHQEEEEKEEEEEEEKEEEEEEEKEVIVVQPPPQPVPVAAAAEVAAEEEVAAAEEEEEIADEEENEQESESVGYATKAQEPPARGTRQVKQTPEKLSWLFLLLAFIVILLSALIAAVVSGNLGMHPYVPADLLPYISSNHQSESSVNYAAIRNII